jgi:hypothetical protein
MTTSSTPDRADVKRTASKKSPSRRNQHGLRGGSSEANRIAVAILEVLAGARSPAEAGAKEEVLGESARTCCAQDGSACRDLTQRG